MSLKDSFAPEDWARIVGAPMLAGIAVTAAEPGGLWGAVKESVAVAGAMRDAKGPGANPLVAEVAAAYETPEGRDLARGVLKAEARGKKPAEVVEAAVKELGAVAALVAQKAPEAAPGFRDWLKAIASRSPRPAPRAASSASAARRSARPRRRRSTGSPPPSAEGGSSAAAPPVTSRRSQAARARFASCVAIASSRSSK